MVAKKKKRNIIVSLLILLLIVVFLVFYKLKMSSTIIGFLNYQVTTLGAISKSNENSSIKLKVVDVDKLKDIKKCDIVLINGMGLKITEEQRDYISKLMEKGLKVFTTAATNPANNLSNLELEDKQEIQKYIYGGGIQNYSNLLSYIRKNIDKKIYKSPNPEPPTEGVYDVLYHPGIEDNKEKYFNNLEEYEKFLSKNNLLIENAKKIAITGQMADATNLIEKLEKENYIVYPILSFTKNLSFIKQIKPDAVINMAHGRMGDAVVNYLKENNILLFCPLSINDLVENWENDPMGMSGGFLSQSVVTPEIDGGICTYSVFSQYEDNDGFRFSFGVPERTEKFVNIINNYFKLKEKDNSDKKVSIVYYKGAGQSGLTAAGLEVIPSLYNFLLKLKDEGYNLNGLPPTLKGFEEDILKKGKVFGTYAEGAFYEQLKDCSPEIINRIYYNGWVEDAMRPEVYKTVVDKYGEFPGTYLDIEDNIALPRIIYGNVSLMPQLPAGIGDNSFTIVHGVDVPPPHPYIASYLWARYDFKADALIHFGTHGSLEFTPQKQVALCSKDWPDILIGDIPHFYVYTIGNVGEGIIAKRRSYAVLQSYLTAPFIETKLKGNYQKLFDAIDDYNNILTDYYKELNNLDKVSKNILDKLDKKSLEIKKLTISFGFHRDLELDSVSSIPYNQDEILKIENFAQELANEKITGNLYVLGEKYEDKDINTSVFAMTVDPIAYSVAKLDKLFNKVTPEQLKHKSFFNVKYLEPANKIVNTILSGGNFDINKYLLSFDYLNENTIERSKKVIAKLNAPKGMMAMMQGMSQQQDTTNYSQEDVEVAIALNEIENAISNVNRYKELLIESPKMELNSIVNSLNGGYTMPSPGGDPIVNPNTLPTGRNLYSINAEETPTEQAWQKGVELAKETIEMYKKRNNGEYPKKVSYTLWSGEFIETGGATIAQVLYMLGVEPIRDRFGRVSDIKLIPSKELGRPRIDVVIQTSGQLRDLAASRLFLINRAVEMAAQANDNEYENLVKKGVVDTEAALTEKGLSPKEARILSTYRVFGGVNGGYGTGIQSMVESGDKWEDQSQIADVYLNNMGAFYGSEEEWSTFTKYAFEASLVNTDVVIQPRQSNTWGPISLDHIYEFMGGLNLAVKQVTGKDPDAYFSDYRNRNYNRMQEVKESIGVESRTTILNPNYISEKMKGGGSSAGTFAEIITNVYGWNVMKPSAIDNELWDDIYSVYVEDKYDLDIHKFFKDVNPTALQELTAVMLESARKGLWNATEQQVEELAKLHTNLVIEYNAGCSNFICNNTKLEDFISQKSPKENVKQYQQSISKVTEQVSDKNNVVMKKQSLNDVEKRKTKINTVVISLLVLILVISVILMIKKRESQNKF